MPRSLRSPPLMLGLLCCGLVHCAQSDSALSDGRTPDFGGGGSFGSNGTGGSTASPGEPQPADAGASALPPEKEVESAFEAPVATRRYVWATNPKSGRVALIDSTTFQVRTETAGDGPTYLAPVPGPSDRAIVLNVFSHDATLLSDQQGVLEKKRFAVAPGANAWSISADGHFAIAWTDATRVANADRIEPFQQITVLDLTDPAAPAKAPVRVVGFRPSSIAFSSTVPRAFAVTQEGITVIDLSDPKNPVVEKTIKLAEVEIAVADAGGVDRDAGGIDRDAGGTDLDARGVDLDASAPDDAARRDGNPAASDAAADANFVPAQASVSTNRASTDVTITPRGDYAVVRYEGSRVVGLVDLATGAQSRWTLSGPVTDVDVTPQGDRAIAVVRSTARVTVLPLPGAPTPTITEVNVEGETIGSVAIAGEGASAVLYSNAVARSRLTVLGLAASPPRYDVLDLHAPVLSVFPWENGQYALVVHNSFDHAAFQSPGAFSVVPLATDRTGAVQATDAPPMSVALAPEGDRALVTVRDDKTRVYGAYLTDVPSLVVTRLALASPPTSAGYVGAEAFISQAHPQGRITFVERGTGRVRTITGFELGASIVEWSVRDGGER